MAKQYSEFNTQKRREAKTNGGKDGKAFSKLMNNAVYRKAMEILVNRIDVNLGSNKKYFLKWTSISSSLSHKIFGYDT